MRISINKTNIRSLRKIHNVFMKANKEGAVPFGYYGPETCRWATQKEIRQCFSLMYKMHDPYVLRNLTMLESTHLPLAQRQGKGAENARV
jgi:hypothetical protein